MPALPGHRARRVDRTWDQVISAPVQGLGHTDAHTPTHTHSHTHAHTHTHIRARTDVLAQDVCSMVLAVERWWCYLLKNWQRVGIFQMGFQHAFEAPRHRRWDSREGKLYRHVSHIHMCTHPCLASLSPSLSLSLSWLLKHQSIIDACLSGKIQRKSHGPAFCVLLWGE